MNPGQVSNILNWAGDNHEAYEVKVYRRHCAALRGAAYRLSGDCVLGIETLDGTAWLDVDDIYEIEVIPT